MRIPRAGWVGVPGWVRWGAGSGAVAALPQIGMLVALCRAGWAPVVDEATISWRSWDVLAGHGPLIGPATAASLDFRHPAYDPGPLLYWALAVPVHLAPRTGLLVGVTLLGAASAVTACVAAAAVGGRFATVTVAGGVLAVGWSVSAQLDGTLWNPYAALPPFGATLVVAWAVAAGRLGWWPCLVGLASFCAQAHLMYAPGSLVLLVAAPLLGVVAARRSHRVVGWRWAAAGTVVGAVCWAAPLWQQLTASPGNLSALWTASHGGATVGLNVGLRNLSRAVAPPRPVWLQPPTHHVAAPQLPPMTWAVVTLAALVVAAGLAYRRKDHAMVALSVVSLLSDLCAVWVIGGIPLRHADTFSYVQYLLWPVGAITWFALGFAVIAPAGRRVAALAAARLPASGQLAGRAALVLGTALVAAAAATTYWQYRDTPSLAERGVWGARAGLIEAAGRTAALVGTAPASGNTRLAINTTDDIGTGISSPYWWVMGTAYLLRLRGWTPAVVAPSLRRQLASVYSPRPNDAVLGMTAGPAPVGARSLGKVDYGYTAQSVSWTVWLRPSPG